MLKPVRFAFILALLLLLIRPVPPAASTAPFWRDKVDRLVLYSATSHGETEFLVYLVEQADLSPAAGMRSKLEKGRFVYTTLSEVATRTQGPVLSALRSLGAAYRPYWVANMIWVRGGLDVVELMARRPDVAHLYANPTVALELPARAQEQFGPDAPAFIEWNLSWVNADDVWNLGHTGQGVVIGGQDTGYDWDHPALINQYRGWNGLSADHNYSWHDAIHDNNPITPPGNPCGFNLTAPCDDHGHGTHTMGTMVGDDRGANQIGMAPGARWIGCRNMEEGWGTPATYSECFQWFVAPTDLNNQNPDPARAPHVINNSWGCPPIEGCTDPNVLLTVVENTRAAGIVVVASAGNAGFSCESVKDPPAIYAPSFSVGATSYMSDVIAPFSSRGPVTVDGSNRLKPDVSAPGVNIRSSVPGGGYQAGWSGTSMAGPHVAGLTGLLISAQPNLAGQVDQLEYIIEQSAAPRTSTQTCGGVPGSQVPNNTYGWGRIDALAAYGMVEQFALTKYASDPEIEPGGILTYTLGLTHTQGLTPSTNVVLSDTVPTATTFLTATVPFTYDGSTVQWTWPSLDVGESRNVYMVVQVNSGASGTITNHDYGVQGDGFARVSGEPVVTLVIDRLVMLFPDRSADALPGDTVTYSHTLTNSGNITDVYDLSHASSLGWPVTIAPSSDVTLGPGVQTSVVVTVTVPMETPVGMVDSLVLTATSQAETEVTDSVTDTTTVSASEPNKTIFLPSLLWLP